MDEKQATDSAGQQNRIVEAHAAFLRWQDVRRAQLGYVVNLVVTFGIASVGFGVKLIFDKPTLIDNTAFHLSLYFLLGTIGFGLLSNFSRLLDFRYTARTAHAREMRERNKAGDDLTPEEKSLAGKHSEYRKCTKFFERNTWCLLGLQLLAFVVGIVLLVHGINQYSASPNNKKSAVAGRFVNLISGDDSVLLDSSTGEWCSPWFGETGRQVNRGLRSCKDVR